MKFNITKSKAGHYFLTVKENRRIVASAKYKCQNLDEARSIKAAIQNGADFDSFHIPSNGQ